MVKWLIASLAGLTVISCVLYILLCYMVGVRQIGLSMTDRASACAWAFDTGCGNAAYRLGHIEWRFDDEHTLVFLVVPDNAIGQCKFRRVTVVRQPAQSPFHRM